MQTTPPCIEDLRWTVFTSPLEITPATMRKMQFWVSETTSGNETNRFRTNNRFIEPKEGRNVYYSLDTETECGACCCSCICVV